MNTRSHMGLPVTSSVRGIAGPARHLKAPPCPLRTCSARPTNRHTTSSSNHAIVAASITSLSTGSYLWHSSRNAVITYATQQSQATSKGEQGQIVVQGSTYEDVIAQLAERALSSLHKQPTGYKLIIGIAGAPGSGKSTLAAAVMEHINHTTTENTAALLPMDGFHYYRRELDQMPDPRVAHARRGAHWTFNADRFVECVRKVRTEGAALVPAFEHGVGDPVEDAIHITPQHRIVMVEGNYVLLDIEPWSALKRELLDDSWFVDVDLNVAMHRVFKRQTGNGLSAEVSHGRINNNDRPNGEYIISHSRHRAAVLVPSSTPWAKALT